MRHALRRRCGFTLTEVLVVMGIIAILGAMLMPAIFAAITKVREGTTRMEVKSLETQMLAYYTEFGEYPPDKVEAGSLERYQSGVLAAWPLQDLTSAEALVFYLGTTFRTDPQKEGEVKATKNVGPLYEFEAKRVWNPGGATDPTGVAYNQDVLVDHLGQDGRDAIAGGRSCFYRFRNNDVPDSDRTPLGVAGYYMGIHKSSVDIWSPGRDGIDCIFMLPDLVDDPKNGGNGDGNISKEDMPFRERLILDLNGDGDVDANDGDFYNRFWRDYGGAPDALTIRFDDIGNW